MKCFTHFLFMALAISSVSTLWAQDNETETAPQGPSEFEKEASADKRAQPVSQQELNRRIEEVLNSLSHEPSLADLEKATLKIADADIESSKRWLKAPRRAALLPAIKLVFDHDMGRDESLDRYQEKPDRWGADTDRDLGFQVSAQWKLDELIFNPDEVRVWNALADRASRREALLNVLVGNYFERRKLQLLKQLLPPKDLAEMARIKLRIAELTASIDAMTGGLLSRPLKPTTKTK